MVKFTASGPNKILIGLGLEPDNITLMMAGNPIKVKLSDLGFTAAIGSVELMIFSGPTTKSMIDAIKPMIGPDTIIIPTYEKDK